MPRDLKARGARDARAGMSVAILASLTAADPGALADAAERLVAAGVDGLHLDIADGRFVPFITFGPQLVRSLRQRLPDAVLDVHLMVERPEEQLDELAAAGATRVAFHVEATRYPWRVVTLARRAGIPVVGVALNPATPLDLLDTVRHDLAFVNLLTTEPDVGGEALLPTTHDRLRRLRGRLGRETRVVVDGGVNAQNLAELVAAGASDVVVGRAITATDDWTLAVRQLRAALT